jgi:uncharacterized protein (TIGR02453 family)
MSDRMTAYIRFHPAARRFFRQLARNNSRTWFEAHRPEYEAHVRGPLRSFVEEMDVRLARAAPELVGDPRRSVFRIHRDVRFSKDKSPYKTNAGCWFYHRDAGKAVGQEADGGGAGVYFHFDARECFVAGGIWMPARPTLARLRDALAEDPAGFGRILRAPAFRRRFGGLDEDAMLTRLPRGFAPGHPAEPWLRFQSFTVHRRLPAAMFTSPKLPAVLERDVLVMRPFIRWLNAALGHRPAERRL